MEYNNIKWYQETIPGCKLEMENKSLRYSFQVSDYRHSETIGFQNLHQLKAKWSNFIPIVIC